MNPYAIVQTGGKQYTVQTGDVLKVEWIPDTREGEEVELTTLAANSGNGLRVGAPELESKVTAVVMGAGKGKKIIVFKMKKRKGYRRKRGHRQPYSALRIESIPE